MKEKDTSYGFLIVAPFFVFFVLVVGLILIDIRHEGDDSHQRLIGQAEVYFLLGAMSGWIGTILNHFFQSKQSKDQATQIKDQMKEQENIRKGDPKP